MFITCEYINNIFRFLLQIKEIYRIGKIFLGKFVPLPEYYDLIDFYPARSYQIYI